MKPPGKKQERIDAIARTFADARAAERIRGDLSADAQALLERIVTAAGPGSTSPDAVGLTHYLLQSAAAPRYAFQRVAAAARGGRAARADEPGHRRSGGVGTDPVGVARGLAVRRPAVLPEWTSAPAPAVVAVTAVETSLPAVVGALDQAMRAWQANPPVALKNGDARIGKGDIRSTAKAIGVDEAVVDLASRLAISIGLLLRNVVGRSGRGRNARVDEVWLGDPTLVDGWQSLAPLERWVRLVAEWCSPRVECGQQLLVNRHLVLWELRHLADGHGYADATHFASWFHDRYASLGHPDAALECIGDLRTLGVLTAGPLALTRLGRAVLDDPSSVAAMIGAASASVSVQADLTVIAPPDLRHDLIVELDAIAALENDAGALTYRLDAGRLTRAVQAGRTPSDIVDFLADHLVGPTARHRRAADPRCGCPGWFGARDRRADGGGRQRRRRPRDGVRDQGAQADQADRHRRRHRRPARQGAHGARAQRAGSGGGDRRWRRAARSSADEAVAAAQQAAALPRHGARPPRQRLRATRPGAGRAGQIDGRRAGPARRPRPGDRHRSDARPSRRNRYVVIDATNPLIVQSDLTVLLEVASPRAAEARARVARFAELEKAPEHIHTYRITPLSLWNAAVAGVSSDDVVDTLTGLAKYPVPVVVIDEVTDQINRYGRVWLARAVEGLVLVADDDVLLDELAGVRSVAELLGRRLDRHRYEVGEHDRGALKQALLAAGWPAADEAGFESGVPLGPMIVTADLRPYQRDAVETWWRSGDASGGSGVVVLPCGAGKTVVGLAAMAAAGSHVVGRVHVGLGDPTMDRARRSTRRR